MYRTPVLGNTRPNYVVSDKSFETYEEAETACKMMISIMGTDNSTGIVFHKLAEVKTTKTVSVERTSSWFFSNLDKFK